MFSQCIRCFKLLDNGSFCPHCGFNNAAYVPEPHHLPPGTVIRERYGIGIALGEGGFGITYAGYDFVLTRRIAIKEYYPGNAVWRDPSKSLNVTCRTSQNLYEEFELGRQKCIHEAQSLANLDDIPGIVRIIDFFQENNTAYIIMEFVEGVTLRRYAQGLPQRMTVAEAAALLRPVTDALEKVHKRGFVHRDISPDNIMITEDDTAKLLDFGAVKSVSSGGSATEHPIVKRGYSPVELYSTTGLIGPWTDVYALAATIVFLTTGTAPEEPTNRMVNDPLPQMLDGICMPAEKAALLHALSVQPQSRPQSVAAFMSELQSAPQYTAAPQTSAFRAAQPQQPDPGRTMPIQQDTGRTMPIQQDTACLGIWASLRSRKSGRVRRSLPRARRCQRLES